MAKEEKLDWFPLYVYEFITDIAGWKNSEVGAYFRLLCFQWINGSLPGDLERLAILANEPIKEFKILWETIGCKFTIQNKQHFNLKLEKVRKQQQKLIEKKSNAGIEGAKARWGGKEKEGITTYFSFEMFWDLYEKKVGEKSKLIKKWDKLTEEERTKALEYIPKYKLAQPDKKYRKNPETFLNNKSWNDELIDSKKGAAPAVIKAKVPVFNYDKDYADKYYKLSNKGERTGETGLGSELKKKMEQLAPKINQTPKSE